jgi:hypothetical protein
LANRALARIGSIDAHVATDLRDGVLEMAEHREGHVVVML